MFLQIVGCLLVAATMVQGEDLYKACSSKQKFCLGLPDACVAKANCEVLLRSSYEPSTKVISLELHSGPVAKNQYVAAAFDANSNMSGLVTECYTWKEKAIIDYSFNVYGAHKNEPIADQSLVKGYKNSSASYEGGKLHCHWQVDASGKATYKTETVSFAATYIKLAAGPIKDGHLGYHHKTGRTGTTTAVDLTKKL